MKYDYLIVGAGFFGSVFAHEATKKGAKCLVIDQRNHIGGNCYTEQVNGINVHKYGPHIFHTNSKRIWQYVNRFSKFNHYTHRPKVNYQDNIYSFPINLMTLYQLWNVKTPCEAIKKLNSVKKTMQLDNLEDWILSQVGEEIYEIFIKGYTYKQWNKDPKELPSSIIKRLPIRLNYNDNYFNDQYQGIPIGGYNHIFEKLLAGSEVKLNATFEKSKWESIAKKLVYTGPIDSYFDHQYGDLEYRSLIFKQKELNIKDFQGASQVNYTDIDVPFTRIIEHKHFEFGEQENTVITYEYPDSGNESKTPYYPVNTKYNNRQYEQYKQLSLKEENVIWGGRLAEYKYYDMHQVIASALNKSKKEFQ